MGLLDCEIIQTEKQVEKNIQLLALIRQDLRECTCRISREEELSLRNKYQSVIDTLENDKKKYIEKLEQLLELKTTIKFLEL
jgi:hypothetical protein